MNMSQHVCRHSSRSRLALFLLVILVPARLAAQEIDTDRKGMDYKDFPLAKADPAECEKACRNDPGLNCKAYTYVKPGVSGSSQAHCWLKKGIPLPVHDSCCVSGIVRQEICVHGNSGRLQKPTSDAGPYGGGLIYDVAGTGSWIQYSIPIPEADTVIEGVKVKFSLKQPLYAWIKAIDVWDSNVPIAKNHDKHYGRELVKNDPVTRTVFVPLLKPVRVTQGVGISIQPETEVAPGGVKHIDRMEFHSVCVQTIVPP